MPKNIVICCDGTGNEFGSVSAKDSNGRPVFENNNSNVVRLYTCLAEGKEQLAYYHPGVGTMGDPNARTRIERLWSKVKGLGFGFGLTDNMADAYRFLMEHYGDGDRIYMFGFSRGAYTVRALAGVLNLYGLLCKGNEGHIIYMLQMYADASKQAFNLDHTVPRRLTDSRESRAFRETFSRTVPIHFMGVWDSVSSVGWIWDPVKLLYDGQNPIVRKGRHAISVDERRCFFQAMPWGKPMSLDDTMNQEDREKLSKTLPQGWTMQDAVQAWFPGVHSDVGGSYRLDESGPAMTAFEWMLNEAKEDGLSINPEKERAVKGEDSSYEGLQKWHSPRAASVTCLHESLCGAWWLLEPFPHKYFDYQGKKHWQLEPWPHSREIPKEALMHPALIERLTSDSNYKPRNLSREEISPLDGTNGPVLHDHIRRDLIAKGYGVYTGEPSAQKEEKELPKVLVAACIVVGVAAYLFSRFRPGS